MQFRLGDNALINMSLISELGIIDFDNIFWFKAKMETIKEIKTHKCEVENMIFEWNKIVLLDKGEIVKKNLNELFSENFIIKDIYYDDVGYFFFLFFWLYLILIIVIIIIIIIFIYFIFYIFIKAYFESFIYYFFICFSYSWLYA